MILWWSVILSCPNSVPKISFFKGWKYNLLIILSWREESNPRPTDYKSVALPTELRQRESIHILFITAHAQ